MGMSPTYPYQNVKSHFLMAGCGFVMMADLRRIRELRRMIWMVV